MEVDALDLEEGEMATPTGTTPGVLSQGVGPGKLRGLDVKGLRMDVEGLRGVDIVKGLQMDVEGVGPGMLRGMDAKGVRVDAKGVRVDAKGACGWMLSAGGVRAAGAVRHARLQGHQAVRQDVPRAEDALGGVRLPSGGGGGRVLQAGEGGGRARGDGHGDRHAPRAHAHQVRTSLHTLR
eukprot:6595822-Pyramimonas_sp.AAC.1